MTFSTFHVAILTRKYTCKLEALTFDLYLNNFILTQNTFSSFYKCNRHLTNLQH